MSETHRVRMGIPRHIGRCHGHRRSSRMSYSVVGFSGDAIGRLPRGDVTSSHQNPILKIEMRQNRHCHFWVPCHFGPESEMSPTITDTNDRRRTKMRQNRHCHFWVPCHFGPESEMYFRRRTKMRQNRDFPTTEM